MAHIKTKSAQGVHDIIKGIKIFDAILHAEVAWEATDQMAIQKCFKHSGIRESYEVPLTPPAMPINHDEDQELAKYFEELLNVPWQDYLAMDEELEQE